MQRTPLNLPLSFSLFLSFIYSKLIISPYFISRILFRFCQEIKSQQNEKQHYYHTNTDKKQRIKILFDYTCQNDTANNQLSDIQRKLASFLI